MKIYPTAMYPDRRNFLAIASTSAACFLAGCEALDPAPEPEILELIQTEPRTISSDGSQDDTEFRVTVENSGIDGNIAIALFWQMDKDAIEPDTIHAGNIIGGFQKVRDRHVYFNSNERRTVEFTGNPPQDAVAYYFQTQAATHGATIRNTGGDGRIITEIEYTGHPGVPLTERRTVYIESESSKDVTFDVVVEPDTEWVVSGDPDT